MVWCPQEKPALWAQILEANEADENEVEHFKDAPALDEEPSEAPGTSDEAAAKDSNSAKEAGAAEPAKDAGGAHRLLEGYDMAKRWAAAALMQTVLAEDFCVRRCRSARALTDWNPNEATAPNDTGTCTAICCEGESPRECR